MNKLFELKFGSHLYGTDTPNSDLDLKSIYIPTAREIVLGSYKKTISTQRPKAISERNTKDDIDIEIFSLDRYLKLLAEGQTVALDILFAPDNMFTYKKKFDHTLNIIYYNREKLLCKDLAAFIGYAKQQAAKYGLKGFRVAALRDIIEFLEQFPLHDRVLNYQTELRFFVYGIKGFRLEDPIWDNAKLKNEYISLELLDNKFGHKETFLKVCDKFYALNMTVKNMKDQIQRRFDQYGSRALKAELNEGQDNKALSHAVRVNSQGLELLTTGSITFPRPDRELLVNIKLGKLHYNEVADIIVEGLEKLKAAEKTSTLREKPDQQWIDDFIFDVYSQEVKSE